jgi:hypothetical protein
MLDITVPRDARGFVKFAAVVGTAAALLFNGISPAAAAQRGLPLATSSWIDARCAASIAAQR